MIPLLALGIGLLLAPSALAIHCGQWGRLGPSQKASTVDRMIASAISGSGGRSYRVDRGAISRCLYGRARTIAYDFDAICGDSRTAGMSALDAAFKNHLWSCVR